jgi:dTDP-4-dehydrorhamnose 3,5-epimerase-like enzyme
MMQTSINDCKLIALPDYRDQRGDLSFIESEVHIPFPIQRIFYLYNVPPQATRGAHAHKMVYQFLICIHGAFTMMLSDSSQTSHFFLDKPSEGLLIPPMIWGELKNFSPDTVCLVLASHKYDPNEYLNNYDTFVQYKIGKLS